MSGSAHIVSMARRLAFAGAWLAVWQLVAIVVDSPLVLPGPLEVMGRLSELVATAVFWGDVCATFARVAAGAAVGLVAAFACGAVSHRWPVMGEVVRAPLAVLKSTPVVCVIVLLLMWFGSRGVPAIAALVVTFPPMYYATVEGLAASDASLDEMLRSFHVSRPCRFLANGWPHLVPHLASASEVSLGMAFKAGVAAEVIGVPLGSVGERIYQAKLLLETADVLAWTMGVVMLATIVSHALSRAVRASAPIGVRLAARLAVRMPQRAAQPCALVLDGVTVAYGKNVVLTHVSHVFEPGTRTVLSDVSGTGKTTLLRTALRLLAPQEGMVSAVFASAMFQEVRLVETLSAFENVVLAVGGCVSAAEVELALAEVLPDVSPSARASSLSGGQRRRVELVRALLAPSEAVLLDEPFSSLDQRSRERCCRFVLERLAGRPLVVASHDEQDVLLLRAKTVHLAG